MKNDTSNKKYKVVAKFAAMLLVAVIISVVFVPGLTENEKEIAALPAETPELIIKSEPSEPLPIPEPIVRAAYIPDIDELAAIPSFEALSSIGDFLQADIDEEGTLSLLWKQSSAIDYYLLYALDEDGEILQTEILWPNSVSWNFYDFYGFKVMLLGFKDMGEDGIDDDTVVFCLMRRIEQQPQDTPELTEKPTSTPKPTATPKPPAEPNKYYIIVDKSKFTFAILEYEEETGKYSKRVRQFPCALGGSATPSGKFKIGSKGEWKTWSSTSFSPYHTRYASGLYFHGPLYSKKDDFGALKPYSYNQIGTTASQGCIRTTVAGALWVYKNCKPGTVVEIVKSSDRVSKITKPSIDPAFPNWDPTDPNKPKKPEPMPTPTPAPTPTPTPSPTPDGGEDDGGDEG